MVVFLILLFTEMLNAEVPSVVKDFSPEIIQELGSNPSADEFTRIDFDGDFIPDNNWDNLERFKRLPVIYYDVIETEKRYYVTFGFFFPRDYASWCIWVHCHENDFEGMRVTVDKKENKAVLLETLAHNERSEWKNPPKITVQIEAEGHGIYLPGVRPTAGKEKYYVKGAYELRPMTDLWSRRETKLFQGTFQYKGRAFPSHFGEGKWTLFGLGVARPPWSWEVHGSSYQKGQWFLDPEPGAKYLQHMVDEFL